MLTWLMFFVGQLCYLLGQVEMIVRAPNNTATSRLRILQDRAVVLLVRAVAGLMLFWIFLGGGLPPMLEAFKIEPPLWLSALSAVINSAAGPPIAWFCGVAVDGLLAFIPIVKTYLPTATTMISDTKESRILPSGAVQTTAKTEEVTTTPPLVGAGEGTTKP